jgi:DNA-binding response OmpR family regulator
MRNLEHHHDDQHSDGPRLTRMQAALQEYLRTHSGANLSRQQLCQEVWRMNYYNSRTVDQTISVVRKHLAEDEAIVTVFGVGYRYERIRQSTRRSSKNLAVQTSA